MACGCAVAAVGAVNAAGAVLWLGVGLPCTAFELGMPGMHAAAAVVVGFLLAAWGVWEEISQLVAAAAAVNTLPAWKVGGRLHTMLLLLLLLLWNLRCLLVGR